MPNVGFGWKADIGREVRSCAKCYRRCFSPKAVPLGLRRIIFIFRWQHFEGRRIAPRPVRRFFDVAWGATAPDICHWPMLAVRRRSILAFWPFRIHVVSFARHKGLTERGCQGRSGPPAAISASILRQRKGLHGSEICPKQSSEKQVQPVH